MQSVVEASRTLYPQITQTLSDQSGRRYNSDQWNLSQLDDWKNQLLPATLKQRFSNEGRCYLTAEELVLLMDWKLAKGKFRPMLPKLIRSNDDDMVKSTTEKGLMFFLEEVKNFETLFTNTKKYSEVVKKAMNDIAKLKGVGPATASLILSLLWQINLLAPPFFSDESFLFLVVDRSRPDTKIKYNMKEYLEELLPVHFEMMGKDSSVNFNRLEQGLWSLKMIDLHRIDKLSDIDVSDYDANCFHHFPTTKANKVKAEKEKFDGDGQPVKKRQKKT